MLVPHLPSPVIASERHHAQRPAPFKMWVLGTQTQALILVSRALCQLCLFPRPLGSLSLDSSLFQGVRASPSPSKPATTSSTAETPVNIQGTLKQMTTEGRQPLASGPSACTGLASSMQSSMHRVSQLGGLPHPPDPSGWHGPLVGPLVTDTTQPVCANNAFTEMEPSPSSPPQGATDLPRGRRHPGPVVLANPDANR